MNKIVNPPTEADTLSKRGFAHVDTWIFDLDNTLYPHEAKLWPQVDERITLFLADFFGLDGLSSRALQKYYYGRYGTTLKGLMEEQGIDPQAFLDFAHQIDYSGLHPNPPLGEAIGRLPGRKLILTNGSRGHAEAVARKLGIRDHFEDVFDIADSGFVPKPEPPAYERFLDKHRVDPAAAAMFEDLAKNLIVPHALGMTTVLVLPKTADPFREAHEQAPIKAPYVEYMTTDLADFLARSLPG
ncbi:pyrimidine 5'-nucleotidase [Chelatococcus sp. SYSU_G07232]|uniref:Pyrimidine 5'-nucleotidase n=1 Tax=Chelatococcus albus TaxID=3047466 RepID=A0ABT7AFS1_9HYPH|nr:pyrimidine 5'-nucleotidase [Chelatococcus sp. SYSU_G07232]MDJ1157689.1 pyrimidine 5'-nucleotidase [Chelatococcus sp. SYSU_G07232]